MRAARDSLNVARLVLGSRANGPGSRAVVWVQGCSIGCEGCCNPDMQDRRRRRVVDPLALLERLSGTGSPLEGLTLTGGEPFEQPRAGALLLAGARAAGLSTVVYSGRTLADLRNSADAWIGRMLAETDVLIDGPFVRARAGDFLWRGSSNQQIRLLSDRYSAADLKHRHAREEIIVDTAAARAVQTGMVRHRRPFTATEASKD